MDLDGTLAIYDGWQGPHHIGLPVKLMVDRVKGWLAEGRDVRIFTARVSETNPSVVAVGECLVHRAIEKWCLEHIGQPLPITNIKDYGMIELWDDRAVQVEANTGMPVGRSTRNLT